MAKFLDHLPLYRQVRIFDAYRSPDPTFYPGAMGDRVRRAAAALVDALTNELLRHAVLHADETPVGRLMPGSRKAHKAYLWTYRSTRFEQARDLSGNSDMTVAQVAELVGSSDARALRCAFQRWAGVLPNEFRSGKAS